MAKKRFNNRQQKSEFEQKLLDLARVVRVVKGGRRFSFRATMIIGNKKGKIGLGIAQGKDVAGAINKAVDTAKKNTVIVKRLDSTISYRVDERFSGAQVMIKPAKDGKGIVAGGVMRLIFELAGIRNITAKSLGSSNKINIAKATFSALEQLEGKKIQKNSKSFHKSQNIKKDKTKEAPKKEVSSKKESKKNTDKKVDSKNKRVSNKTPKKSGKTNERKTTQKTEKKISKTKGKTIKKPTKKS